MDSTYIQLCNERFDKVLPFNAWHSKLFADFPTDSEFFTQCFQAMLGVELNYVEHLVRQIKDDNILGDFVEFGIYQGSWINTLYNILQQVGLKRQIWGFDSFKGLSQPGAHDSDFWKEGMYSCSLEEVSEKVFLKERPEIRLVEGFFSTSLKSDEAAKLGTVAYARIDCDLYEPAIDCLNFLTDRLADGSILVFDDWMHNASWGESKAFFEWSSTLQNLHFEYLCLGPWDHLYLRVHKK